MGLLRFVQDRLKAHAADAKIEFVFSNRAPGEAEGSDQFFQAVKDYGLPLVTHSSAKFRREIEGRFADHRADYDQQVMAALAGYKPDICVLAGYMLIMSGEMCRRYPLLNLHPALPDGPIGTWQQVVWSLIETRATHTGAMLHLATEDVDRGPVVSYVTVPITGPKFDSHWEALEGQDLEEIRTAQGGDFPLFQLVRNEQYLREPYLLFETLRALSQEEIAIRNGSILDAAGRPLAETMPKGLQLDQQIAEAMAGDSPSEEG